MSWVASSISKDASVRWGPGGGGDAYTSGYMGRHDRGDTHEGNLNNARHLCFPCSDGQTQQAIFRDGVRLS